MLVHLSVIQKSVPIRVHYQIRKEYPTLGRLIVGSKPWNKLEQWSKDVEIYMAYDGDAVYFETEEDSLNFKWTWQCPPYGTKGN